MIGTSAYDFSYSFWLNLKNWNYRNRVAKHVFTKGRNDFRLHNNSPVCPAVFIDGRLNDLIFHINVGNGASKIRLEDFPIKKWFHVAMVCRGKTIDIYLDGKVNKTVTLSNYPKMNYGDLFVNHHGGFDGSIASLMYSPSSWNPNQVSKIYNAGHDGQSKLLKQLKKIGEYLGVVKSSDSSSSSGGCAVSKVSTEDSSELTEKEAELAAAKEALKLAQQNKNNLSSEIKALKQQESISREAKIRSNFNKLDTNKNKNISYSEFKKYSTN